MIYFFDREEGFHAEDIEYDMTLTDPKRRKLPETVVAKTKKEDAHENVPYFVDPKWEVVNMLGRGGMGDVWLAHEFAASHNGPLLRDEEGELLIKRNVVIKVLKKECLPEGAEKLFQREREALIAVENPHVLPIYDVIRTVEGDIGLVMGYASGGDLHTLMEKRWSNRSVPPDIVANIGAQICIGLEEVHRQGFLHRDIKETNILVVDPEEKEPRVMVSDFGIAGLLEKSKDRENRLSFLGRPIQDTASRTEVDESNFTVGSPMYMAPEQCLGEQIDERVDLYALGTLLYGMWTGQHPYEDYIDDEDPRAVMSAIISKENKPKSIHAVLGEEERNLERIIMQLLEKDTKIRSSVQLRDGKTYSLRTALDVAKTITAAMVREDPKRAMKYPYYLFSKPAYFPKS